MQPQDPENFRNGDATTSELAPLPVPETQTLNDGDGATTAAAAARGTVKWFNEKKGFGFIVDPNVPTDIFVHFSAIRAEGFRTLNEGDQVQYELYSDEKGAKARNVVRL